MMKKVIKVNGRQSVIMTIDKLLRGRVKEMEKRKKISRRRRNGG
jgi:hypothetical protein